MCKFVVVCCACIYTGTYHVDDIHKRHDSFCDDLDVALRLLLFVWWGCVFVVFV